MKRRWANLPVGLVVAGLFGNTFAMSLAYTAEWDGGQFADARSDSLNGVKSGIDGLPADPSCERAISSSARWHLCDELRRYLDPSASDALSQLLQSGVQDTKTLCEIDAAIVQMHRACARSKAALYSLELQSLMRDLAKQWRLRGNLGRADDIYERLYARSSAQQASSPLWLWAGELVRDWATLKLQRGEQQAARDLVASQVQLSREAYVSGMSPMARAAMIRDLRLQAAILTELGSISEARAALQEVEALSVRTDQKPIGQPWMASYILPKLQPTLEGVKQEIRARVPGVHVRDSQAKSVIDESFAIRIEFSAQHLSQEQAIDVNVRLECGAAFTSPPGVGIDERPGFRLCRSYVTRGLGEDERVLRSGPKIEIALDAGNGVRDRVDKWSATTAAFFHGSTTLVITNLQSGEVVDPESQAQ